MRWIILLAIGAAPACSVAEAAGDPPAAPVDSLEAIVVKSEKLAVESLIDRKVYTVTSDAQSTFGTLSDILSNIPSVDVDPTGIVSLRGDTKVLILIDGKPSSQFAGASAGDNLQSIPAKDIERIEVLTTPPVQFKADGAAGVINIITRKKHPAGTTGSLQASAGSGARYVLGTDGSYSSGPLAVSVGAGYRQDYRERRVQSSVIAPDPASGQLIDSRNSISERIRREVPTVKLSAAYALNDQQSISGSASWADRGGLRTYTQLTDGSAPSGITANSARRLSSGHDPEIDYDEKLAFAQKLGKPGETLDFSLHRSTSHQHEHYDYTNDSFVPPAATFYNNLSFHEDHGTTEFGADYALPTSDARSLKLGYAFEQDDYRFGNVGENIDPLSGVPLPDPTLTNQFKFRQVIHAAYASYQAGIGMWTWLGGLRAEEVHTDAEQLTNGIATSTSYFQIYPSLHVDRSLSDHTTLSFGASRRVSRPDPSYLNPYVDHEYTPNLSAGNPDLRPQYSRSYEVGSEYEGRGRSFSLTGYYRLNRDSVTDVTEYLADGLSLTTKTNLPRDKSAGMEFSANGRIVQKLTYSISANFFYSQIDARALASGGLQSTTGLNAKAKLDYRPTEANSLQIALTRTDKRLTPQGYVSAIDLVNLGYKYQVKVDLTAVLTVTDLFNGQRFHRFSTSPAFTQDYQRFVFGRILYVGLVYSFGSKKKDQQPGFEYEQPG
ncbi:MAG TPA: outer membrane beta-barrel family protein [Steroidobacteraceae bacterium]|nr:outer membrane beta-barrel family protein [Steroidobacteraceae bacterium]